jgi:hypothetical protein
MEIDKKTYNWLRNTETNFSIINCKKPVKQYAHYSLVRKDKMVFETIFFEWEGKLFQILNKNNKWKTINLGVAYPRFWGSIEIELERIKQLDGR